MQKPLPDGGIVFRRGHVLTLDPALGDLAGSQGLVNAGATDEFAMAARQALALGTIEGARSLGLGDVCGSVTPGKQADLILVSTDAPNLAEFTGPAQMLVAAAQPGNVHTVLCGGQFLKRDGALVTLNPAETGATARSALAGIRARG